MMVAEEELLVVALVLVECIVSTNSCMDVDDREHAKHLGLFEWR
jgi:hypothetical protein